MLASPKAPTSASRSWSSWVYQRWLRSTIVPVPTFIPRGCTTCELVSGCQNLLHQQAGRNGFEHVVDGFSNQRRFGRWLSNKVGESRCCSALCVSRGSANDLDNHCQAAAVADRQRMFTPYPVKAFHSHAQRNDDVHMVPVILLCWVFEGCQHLGALCGVAVVYQVGHPHLQGRPQRSGDGLPARREYLGAGPV